MSKWILPCMCGMVLAAGVAVSTPHALAGGPAPTPAPAAPSTQPAVDSKPVNTKCPVTGEDIDPKMTVVYEGKTIAFCCDDCVKAFKKNPDKYLENVK
jgi:YHS domain-containing protein